MDNTKEEQSLGPETSSVTLFRLKPMGDWWGPTYTRGEHTVWHSKDKLAVYVNRSSRLFSTVPKTDFIDRTVPRIKVKAVAHEPAIGELGIESAGISLWRIAERTKRLIRNLFYERISPKDEMPSQGILVRPDSESIASHSARNFLIGHKVTDDSEFNQTMSEEMKTMLSGEGDGWPLSAILIHRDDGARRSIDEKTGCEWLGAAMTFFYGLDKDSAFSKDDGKSSEASEASRAEDNESNWPSEARRTAKRLSTMVPVVRDFFSQGEKSNYLKWYGWNWNCY